MAKARKDTKILRYEDIKSKIQTWVDENTPEVVLRHSRTWLGRLTSRLRHTSGVGLVGVILVTFLISLAVILPKDRFQQAKERLVRNPNDFEAHLILAEEYLKNNQLDEAEKELLLAQKIQPLNYQINRLGQKKMEANPEEVKKLVAYWEKITSEKPNYRDAFLQLALLHYKTYENEKAQEYLKKALELDPNFEPAREMEKILK